MASAEPVAHPLVDDVRSGVVLTRAGSAVVGLSPLRADLLQSSARARTRVVLITPAGSRLTRPLTAALSEVGAGWAAEREQGGWYDGRSGRVLGAPEQAVDPAGPDDRIVPEFLRRPLGLVPQLAVTISTRHRADPTTLLGGAIEAVVAATGGSPGGWGPHEPVEAPWDRSALTAFARAAAPAEVQLQTIGWGARPFAGSLLARRTAHGIEEVVELVLGTGPAGAEAAPAVLDAIAGLARTQMPLFALVTQRDGEPDLTVRPVAQEGASPQGVLIGAPAVRTLRIDAARLASRFGGRVVGRSRLPALLVPLGGDRGGSLRLAEVVDAIGVDRLRSATGVEVPDAP